MLVNGVITVDVSEYQRPVNDSYPHQWISFRINDGTYVDRNATANLAWARKAAAAGKIAGYTCYCVFRPNTPTLQTLMRVVGQPDQYMTVMIDVESWGGQIHGNQSQAITALANGVGEWLGDRRRVIAYGNHNDLVGLYPVRPSWLRIVVASYGSTQPAFPNLIGWQYSDGDGRWPVPAGLPRKSKPFGACDHNIFPGFTAAELAAELGVGGDMPLSDQDVQKIANAVWARKFTDPLDQNPDPSKRRQYPAATYLVYGNRYAAAARAAADQATAAAKAAGASVHQTAVDAAAVAADITSRTLALLASKFGGTQ